MTAERHLDNTPQTPGTPDTVEQYFALAAQRPDLFTPDDGLVMDPEEMRDFSRATGRPMGLVYDNRPYYMVLADLYRGGAGRLASYARVVYPQPGTNGAVAVPRRGERYGLLRSFRHAPRAECLEFPRGFAEEGLTPEENIRKELDEEMGAEVRQLRYLGDIRADTGLSSGCVQVFLAEVDGGEARVGHEGIRELIWMTEEELRAKIAAGEITDGFTLSALTLLACGEDR